MRLPVALALVALAFLPACSSDGSDTGDLSEFPGRLDAVTTTAITVSSEECPGARR